MSLLFDSRKDRAEKGKWNPIIRNRQKQAVEDAPKCPKACAGLRKVARKEAERYQDIPKRTIVKKGVPVASTIKTVTVPSIMPGKINEQIGFKI